MIRNLLLALAVIVLCLLGATLIGSEYRLKRKYVVAASPVSAESDSASVSRGGHLYQSIGCRPVTARMVAARCTWTRGRSGSPSGRISPEVVAASETAGPTTTSCVPSAMASARTAHR